MAVLAPRLFLCVVRHFVFTPPIAAHVFVHSDGLRRSPQTFSDRGTPLTVKINSTHPVSFLNVIYIEYSFFFFAVELSLTERKVRVDELMIF